MNILETLKSDQTVDLGSLLYNDAFITIVSDVEDELEFLADRKLDISLLMQAQYICASLVLPKIVMNRKHFMKIVGSLSQYEHADIFLEVLGYSTQQYCQWSPGLSDEQFELMMASKMSLRDLLEVNPATVFAPLLRANVRLQ